MARARTTGADNNTFGGQLDPPLEYFNYKLRAHRFSDLGNSWGRSSGASGILKFMSPMRRMHMFHVP